MSRLEKVMRELSDLRSFYLKLQKTRRESQRDGFSSEFVAEEPSTYSQKTVVGPKDIGNGAKKQGGEPKI